MLKVGTGWPGGSDKIVDAERRENLNDMKQVWGAALICGNGNFICSAPTSKNLSTRTRTGGKFSQSFMGFSPYRIQNNSNRIPSWKSARAAFAQQVAC